MRQMSRRMEMIKNPTIGWRRDEHETNKYAHGSWILWSVSRALSKHCIYVTVASHYSMLHRFQIFLPLEQSRTALLGCRLVASRVREAARWQQTIQFL